MHPSKVSSCPEGPTPPVKHRPQKKWGQNFLIHEETIHQICAQIESFTQSQHQPHKCAVEIGPGRGALTFPLLQKQWSITAIEIDPALVGYLKKRMQNTALIPHQSRLNLVYTDARKWLLQDSLHIGLQPTFIFSSLPYSSASHLILTILEKTVHFQTGMFLLPKEMAQKICQKDGSLGIFLASMANFQTHPNIRLSASRFFPQPKVSSQLISFVRHPQPLANQKILSMILKMSFSGRRKKLKNAWSKQFRQYEASFSQAFASLNPTEQIKNAQDLSSKKTRQKKIKNKADPNPLLAQLLEAANHVRMPMEERPENIPPEKYYHLSQLLAK